jgi:cytochrome P450
MSFIREQIARTLKNSSMDKGEEPTNYIQAFYKAQCEERNWTFTDEQLVATVQNLFVAGFDTTAGTVCWGILYMAYNPELQEQIYEEIKNVTGSKSFPSYSERTKLPLTEAATMELLRLANVAPIGVMRRTIVPSKLHGYDIPADAVVVPLLTSVLWNPKIYPNPSKFDPTRFLNGRKGAAEFTNLVPFQVGTYVTKIEYFFSLNVNQKG